MKINIVEPDKQKYLQILANIANPPKTLACSGTLPSGRLPTVAIVGTRKPTNYGKEVTHQLAYELASRGIVIVSGLALGVDGMAHQAALEAGGTTIAVLGCGLPRIYPSAHQNLASEITEKGGALLSEYQPDEEARPHYFLERNRLVSGLSDAIIITEAASRSGTLNTAAHALEQGKEIFVVPGNITSPLSAACNELLKQGARPVTSYNDVLEHVAPVSIQPQTSLALGSTPLETTLLELLKAGVRDGDELLHRSGALSNEFASTLTIMEINGLIRALGANQWTIK